MLLLSRGNTNTRLLLRFLIDFTILLGVFCVAFVAVPFAARTAQRGFFCSDASLRYPYTASALSKVHLTILVVALPATVILVVELLRAALTSTHATHSGGNGGVRPVCGACLSGGGGVAVQQYAYAGKRIPTFISECYQAIGVYLFGFALELIVTELSKRLVGRLRPYFYDVCQPQQRHVDVCGAGGGTGRQRHLYVDYYQCSELAVSLELLNALRHSFPSGYTASAAYAMCFLVVYLQARLTAVWLRLFRALAQCLCLGLVGVVAHERLTTYQNHWSDVLAGATCGCIFAAFATIVIAKRFRRERVKMRRGVGDAEETQTIIYGYGYGNGYGYGYPGSRLSAQRYYWQR